MPTQGSRSQLSPNPSKAQCPERPKLLRAAHQMRFRTSPPRSIQNVKYMGSVEFRVGGIRPVLKRSKRKLARNQVAKRGAAHVGLRVLQRRKASIHAGCSLAEGTRATGCMATPQATTTAHRAGALQGLPSLRSARQPTRNSREAIHEWSISFGASFAFRARAGCDCAAA